MKQKETVSIPQRLLLTIEEAAEYSGISERVWRDRLLDGEYNFIL